MSVAHVIDTLCEWARVNICDHIELKKPPSDLEGAVDIDYQYETQKPTVFPMYVPAAERLPPNVHSQFPSLCVRFTTGQDNVAGRSGFLNVQFCFSAWNPGLHGQDIFHPVGGGAYQRQPEAYTDYIRTADGWRDVWNFVDIALRALESVTNIGGYTIDSATPIEYGPLTEQEAIPDFYPFWFAWVSFRVNYPLMRNNDDYENFL